MQKEHSAVVIWYKQQLQQSSTNAWEMNEFTFELMNEVQQAHYSEKTSKDVAKTLREKTMDMTVKLNDHSRSLNDLTDEIRDRENHILDLKNKVKEYKDVIDFMHHQ